MSAVAVDLDALTACEAVASGRGDVARAAFVTWLVAQSLGWAQARLRVSRTTWYRHLALLDQAGIPVPTKHQRRHKSSSIREHDSGAGLLRMVGMRFVLTESYDEFTDAGMRGTVLQILFRDSQWIVGVQFDGSPGSYEELCIGTFARIAEWVQDDAA